MNRFSSRQTPLDESFLNQRLKGAIKYDRIAGYFSSSILEVAGEAIESMTGKIRIICNSDLEIKDVETARAANYALRREWCSFEPEKLDSRSKPRLTRLYQFLKSEKMEVKVLPRDKFGLVHGKAGVITLEDGTQTSFLGSINETYSAWKLNYELLWEDNSAEAIAWVQTEFDSLWHHPLAVNLADFIIQDIGRVIDRQVIPSVQQWREEANPAAAVIETPVYRQEYGLWEHQKYFVKLAFEAHQKSSGARYLLADQVGLGKTMQLAMSAMLMGLWGNRPILILVPKPLLWQWQEEMKNLLDMPSAVWDGKRWIDENAIEYPTMGAGGIKKCPRQIGIVSQGLVTSGSEASEHLLKLSYECVIVDESHRARRKNIKRDQPQDTPEPNNLLAFLEKISHNTHSLLLATATPVQIHPIEAWDLLRLLDGDREFIFGKPWSPWRFPERSLPVVMGQEDLPDDDLERWNWIRNPLPPSDSERTFQMLRRSLKLDENTYIPQPETWEQLRSSDKRRVKDLAKTFGTHHNPYIRHIVRRTREFLENTINPETNEPYLQPVKVQLLGEKPEEAIRLPPYLQDAYAIAEEFCRLINSRLKTGGFFKTFLLRRVGSTLNAGRISAEKMLEGYEDNQEKANDNYGFTTVKEYGENIEKSGVDSDLISQKEYFQSSPKSGKSDDTLLFDELQEDEAQTSEKNYTLTLEEQELLRAFIDRLKANQERDPKYQVIVDLLLTQKWLEQGCIIFSQYFDSIWWLAQQLTETIPNEAIGIYAGGSKSGIMLNGRFNRCEREKLKTNVKLGEIRLILGTDAASEGLNLQRLGTLINLDLPWNPTRLEQRKGRIQRIGQIRETVLIYNLRYQGSVEDRVHELLSDRLSSIHAMFGQIPDVLEDVWIDLAIGEIEKAKSAIDAIPQQHPFELKYHNLKTVEWESCTQVLDAESRRKKLLKNW